jgi:nucleoside-diphosphate-sugar epimerase
MIIRGQAVPVPIDATAGFNFVYVRDAARAVSTVIGDERAFGATFNLAQSERVTYNRLLSDLERISGGAFETREMTVDEIEREQIIMPFPLTTDDFTDGTLFARTFDFSYTPFSDGLEETFQAQLSLNESLL